MKTSNKLICFGLLVLIVIATSIIVSGKSSMVDKVDKQNNLVEELNRKIEEGGDEIVQKSLGILKASKLDLDGNHRYILDPTINEIVVTGKRKIVNDFEDISEDKFFDAPIYTEVTSRQDERNDSRIYDRITDTLYYTIGIKDCNDLLLLIGNESKVTATAPLQLESLGIHMEGNAHIAAEVNCKALEIRSRDAGHAELHGEVSRADITLDDDSSVESYGLIAEYAEVMLNDNSRLELKVVTNTSGFVKNNAYYGNAEKIDIDNLIIRDNGRVDNK